MRLTKNQRRGAAKIIVSLAAFLCLFLFDRLYGFEGWLLPFALYSVLYIFVGYRVLYKAFGGILRGQLLDENFLMCIASLGAFALGIYRAENGLPAEGFDEACAVLIFYNIGQFFEDYATSKARREVGALMDIRPDFANLGGERVSPEKVAVGDIITVYAGERVPLDGVVISGVSTLDTRALTGESIPREVCPDSEILSGSINLISALEIRVTRPYGESTVSKILALVEDAADSKSKTESFITRFARFYTPAVVGAAALLALLPSLITGQWSVWVYRALNFLVVSCPCALVISVPLSFFAGIGAASKKGVLVKGSNFLELLGKAKTFVFDKTGTLTRGDFEIFKVAPQNNADKILALAATAERDSAHPIALGITRFYSHLAREGYTVAHIAGEGVVARGESEILCGNARLMEHFCIEFSPYTEDGTVIYVAENGKFEGYIVLADAPKPEAHGTVSALTKSGCKTLMLSGDNEKTARAAAKALSITDYRANLLPADKVLALEAVAKEFPAPVCFVGDGINDAPVLMRADVGIAMGALGSDAAIEAADVVLMTDNLEGIIRTRKIAAKTVRIVRQNIILSLGIKLLLLVLSAVGLANMWLAVFGDVGVAIIAILNAMRVNK